MVWLVIFWRMQSKQLEKYKLESPTKFRWPSRQITFLRAVSNKSNAGSMLFAPLIFGSGVFYFGLRAIESRFIADMSRNSSPGGAEMRSMFVYSTNPPLPPQYFVDLTLMIPFILRYCDLFFDLQNEFMREWFSNRIYKFHPDSSLAHELKSLNFNRNESSTNTFPSGGLPGSAIPEWKSNDSLEENPFKPFSSEKTHQ